MITLTVCAAIAIVAWALVGERLRSWHISGAVAMVLVGIATGFFLQSELETGLNTVIAERVAEVILALLLFVDAIEVRGGFLAGERSRVLRLLLIALPVSIVFATVVGLPLLGTSVFAVIVMACVVLPLDFAPAPELLRDPTLPRGMRHALAAESGYNDGILSPLFACALLVVALPGAGEHETPLDAIAGALPAIGYALLFGAGIGGAVGLLVRWVTARRWAPENGVRIAMVLVPLITYACAVAVGGNGFVAAFVAGLAYKFARSGFRETPEHHHMVERELSLADDIANLSSLFMWFVFGAVVSLIFVTPVEGPWILFALLALTVLRMLPVYLAFLGSSVPFREQTALGFAAPRGTSSIVFGLLAFNAMRDDDANIALYVLVVTVLGSVVLHGLFGTRITRALIGKVQA